MCRRQVLSLLVRYEFRPDFRQAFRNSLQLPDAKIKNPCGMGYMSPELMRLQRMEQVGAGVERVVANGLRHAPQGEGPLLAWPVTCGSAVAQRTRALHFTDGILRVEVPDKGWRAELQALAPQYLAVMNRYVAESVKRIEFVVKEKADASEGARAT
jgi:Dna[CI] antecedent, DciA